MVARANRQRTIPIRDKKTLIGVLASYDSEPKNEALARTMNTLYRQDGGPNKLAYFHFLFTGGTFDRLFRRGAGAQGVTNRARGMLTAAARAFFLENSTRLPGRREGGVTILANYLVSRQCSILWPFYDPTEGHWLSPENLALTRLCDVWHVKRLRNSGSLEGWFAAEADADRDRNKQSCPPVLTLASPPPIRPRDFRVGGIMSSQIQLTTPASDDERPPTIALIAHDEMKERMIDFAVQYENELDCFGSIMATATTGRSVEEAVPRLKDQNKIKRYLSGPKGGDIQIATEILAGRCDVIVFFLDPLRPHPHADDIRVVLGACMVENNVRILTNEVEAREWMEAVPRRGQEALSRAVSSIRSRSSER